MASILIADDDAHIVRVMTIWLQRHGHRVTAARNGREALHWLETPSDQEGGSETIDLIITDVNMPLLDGVQFTSAVRERFGDEMPIIMLTARCDQDRLSEQLAGRAVQIFPKPFLPSQLVAEIDRLLGPVGA